MIYLVSNRQYFWTNGYTFISLEKSIFMLENLSEIGLDTETTGLSCHTKKLLLLQLGNFDFQILYDIESFNYTIPNKLKDFMNNYHGIWIIQNAKFDLQFLFKQDILLLKVYDTMLAETIITMGLQEGGRDLKTLVEKYCNEVLDKSVRGEIISTGLSDRVLLYAANDIKFLPLIKKKQKYYIDNLNVGNAVKLDNAFVRVLAYIEYCGIKLDWNKWKIKADKDIEDVQHAEQELNKYLYEHGGSKYFLQYNLFSEFPDCMLNWNSASQIIPVFEELGINCTVNEHGEIKKTVEEKSLKSQIKNFPILQLYFKYKGLKKQSSTYGYNWESMINSATHRIHTSFKQIMSTGRLSSGDTDNNQPNLQNLPNDEYVRSCFVSEPGNKYIAVDFSSQESVVLANFANDESLINFYKKGLTDMHSYVAYLLYPEIREKPIDELTNDDLKKIKKEHHDYRQIAKTAEFAIGYGGNGSTIAKNTGCSKAQGEKVYNDYFEAFSGMKKYFVHVLQKTLRNKYIEYNPVTNRKFFISPNNPVIKYADKVELGILSYSEQQEYKKSISELQRLSQNYPIQGSSSDISKLAGILFFDKIIKKGWFNIVKIVNMIHDEYNVEAPNEIADEVTKMLISSMREAGAIFCKIIPLDADAAVGDHWIH